MVQRKSFDLYLARTAGMLSGARRVAAVLLVMMLTTVTAWASTFSGGDGSSGNPYQIASTADLNQLAADVNGGNTYYYVYFVLTADIAYTYTKAWNDATSTENNYTAIGDNSHYFNGKFDGQGHTISGIRIYKGGNSNADDYQGLFGRIGSGAEVKNVILADTRITGCDDTGGIVGYNDRGKVTNCHVTSDVTIHAAIGASSHGGIAGRNIGTGAATITGCTSAAALTTHTDFRSSYVGGITGNNSGGIVTNCLYLGTTLEGYSRAGAIVGDNSGTVENCYFTSTTIQGKDNNHNALTNAESAVGYNADGGTVTNCGLSDIPWTGSGTSANDPYMIYTKDQLDMLAQRVNDGTSNYSGKYFKLGANIAYNKSTENNFTPIGKNNYGFYGTFDGQGYTISGININSGSAEKGIFGYVDGTVKNLVVSNCSIVGFARVGAIAGYLRNGTIENCHVGNDVTLSGNGYVGGIAGVSERGTIKGCTSAATITGTIRSGINADKLGGIVGATVTSSSSSTLTDNIFTGTITTDNLNEYIGAVVGQNNNGTLTNNYYTSTGFGGIGAASSTTGADGVGARQALTISAGTDVTLTPKGTPSTYDVSGITVYASNTGMSYGGTLYAGATEAVTLTLAYSGTVPEGYTLNYIAIGTISGNATDGYTLTMPNDNVTVIADFDVTPWTGSGDNADDPYIILYSSQLDLLAQRVNDGNAATGYSGKYFKLGANIAYNPAVLTIDNDNDGTNDSNFTPIGYNIHPFYGTFDGQGFTISGININSSAQYKGIFGFVNGTVKNLVVSNSSIVGVSRVGVIAGSLQSGTIENCHVGSDVTLSGNAYVGGIVGESEGGTIKGCTSAATITGIEASGWIASSLGGIVGAASTFTSSNSTLTDNIFTGTITGALNEYIGAIVGDNDGGTLKSNFYTSTGFGGIGAASSTTGADGVGARKALTMVDGDGITDAVNETLKGKTIEISFARTFEALSSGEGKASTLCLPFDLAKPSSAVGTFYTFGGVSDATGEYVVTMNEVTATTLTAGTPYMIRPATTDLSFQNTAYTVPSTGFTPAGKTTDANGWEFKGTYEEITWPDGQTRLYAFAAANFKKSDGSLLNEVGAFRRFDYGHANPFRCYLWAPDPSAARDVSKAGSQLPDSMKVILVSASGETTAVGSLDTRTGEVTFGDEWYSLDGRRLNGKPNAKGVYINNGNKIVVK